MSDAARSSTPPSHATGRPAGARGGAAALQANALSLFSPQAYEEEVVYRSFYGRRQIVLNRPEAIQHILIDNPDNYRRTAAGIRILRPILGDGLFLSRGDNWKEQRRIAAPAFAPRTIPLVARHVASAAAAEVAELAAGEGRPVDLLARLQRLALEIAGRAMFSLDIERFGGEMRQLIRLYAVRLGRPSLFDLLLPLWIPSPRDFARRRFRRRWLGLIGRLVASRRNTETGEATRDLFALLSAGRDPQTGAASDPEHLLDQVATMIVAGHETTAVAMFWALFLLADAPAVQERLAAEAADVDLGPEAAAVSLPRLVYARAVVQEALRLYPPAFAIFRQARAADVAGGVAIPARAVAVVAPWVLHRHHRLWAEPERFDPERFLPGAPPPARFAYLPFGAGPRVCIGSQFALTEATLVLAALARSFRFARADDMPVTPRAIVTTQPDRAPLFLLHRRSRP